MVLKPGDKVMVVHRRLFETDQSRYFVGAVEEYDGGVAKVTGFTCVRTDGGFVKKDERRTKIIPIASGALMTYQLPSTVDLDVVAFQDAPQQKVVLTDGRGFEFDMTERPVIR